MNVCRIRALTALAAISLAHPAYAADEQEIARIREEINQLKDSYETRIRALEQRLDQAQQQRQTQSADVRPAGTGPASQNAFNPALSLSLTGGYVDLSQNPGDYRIDGFLAGGEEFGPGERGFRLGRTELAITSNIDPYFRGEAFITLHEGEVEVEQAYLHTLGLAGGTTVKFGRFLSAIGYLNEQHEDFWDFVDAPLAYRAFLGTQFAEDGVQVKWIAPTDLFVELGADGGRGLGAPASDRNKNGLASGTVFAHLGGDVGDSHSWRAGVSYLQTSPEGRETEAPDRFGGGNALYTFSGKSKVWIADLIWKWAPQGNPREHNFKFQAEYLKREENGMLAYDDSAASGSFGALGPAVFESAQSGWYAQAVYQFIPRWRAGLRFDRLSYGSVSSGLVDSGTVASTDLALLAPHDPERTTAMLDYSPSEFSRFRLQFGRDESRAGAADNQLYLQYIMSLGAHGAHRF